MSFLSAEAIRLLASKWPNAELLAQELYSIFAADADAQATGPQTLNNYGNAPALTINQFGNSGTAIQINRKPNPLTFGDIHLDIPPGLLELNEGFSTVVNFNNDGTITYTSGPADQPLPPFARGGSVALLGRVVSGSGTNYTVELYEAGADKPATRTRAVRALGIAEDATLPPGTWLPVFAAGADDKGNPNLWVIPPVWLAPLPQEPPPAPP